jgi:hypothetical protein
MGSHPAGARTVEDASVSWMPDAGVTEGAGGLEDSLVDPVGVLGAVEDAVGSACA